MQHKSKILDSIGVIDIACTVTFADSSWFQCRWSDAKLLISSFPFCHVAMTFRLWIWAEFTTSVQPLKHTVFDRKRILVTRRQKLEQDRFWWWYSSQQLKIECPSIIIDPTTNRQFDSERVVEFEIQKAEKILFEEVLCTLCYEKALLCIEIYSTCMPASIAGCANHLPSSASAL